MRFAIISDIHANRAGLEAVLADAAGQNVDQYVFLGDMIGLGPDPVWVLERIEDMVAAGAVAVRGNHDRIAPSPANLVSAPLRRVIDWSIDQLNARQRLFLADLPLVQRMGDMLFVHASADRPQDWTRIDSAAAAEASLLACDAAITFAGHTHSAAHYTRAQQGPARAAPFASDLVLTDSQRWLITCASVGLNPNGAAYCLYDSASRQLRHICLPYDMGQTLRRAAQVAMPLAQKLPRASG